MSTAGGASGPGPAAQGTGLSGRVALVTGAGRGIGRAIALAMAEAGAEVALAARTVAEIEAVAEEVRSRGRRALVLPTDMSVRGQAVEAVARAAGELGRLDILVNNAGGPVVCTADPRGLWVESHDDASWDATLVLNLTSCYWATRAALGPMLRQGYGRVITSARGTRWSALPGCPPTARPSTPWSVSPAPSPWRSGRAG